MLQLKLYSSHIWMKKSTRERDAISKKSLNLKNFAHDGRSIIKIRNTRRLKMEPYGTPCVIKLLSNNTWSKDTFCYLLVKYHGNHCLDTPHLPNESSLARRMEWSMQSDIFLIQKEWNYTTATIQIAVDKV